jgi:polysaccharide deacetylase 2 family uncharacterized protein YibQ
MLAGLSRYNRSQPGGKSQARLGFFYGEMRECRSEAVESVAMARKRKSEWNWRGWAGVALSAAGAFVGVAFAVLVTREPPPRLPPRTVLAIPALPVPPPLPPRPQVPVAQPVVVAPPPPAPEQPRAEPPWRRYAASAGEAEGRIPVAVVLDDLGLDRVRTERAIALAAPLTLSFMSYAPDVRQEAGAARERGHELLVHVPMEPLNHAADMGPNGLAVGLPADEVLRRLRWDLGRFDGYVGINNHMGSRFTADGEAMEPVIGELKTRGLLFLDSRTSGRTVGAMLAQRAGVPFAERDVFLDDDQAPAAIAARLRDLEAAARRNGSAIAIGHPHDTTLASLAAWIKTLPSKHLQLVPLTAIVALRAGRLLHAGGTRTVQR